MGIRARMVKVTALVPSGVCFQFYELEDGPGTA